MSEPPDEPRVARCRWTLSFLRPYRRRVVAARGPAARSRSALGALQPWPLKIVIDYVLERQPLAGAVRRLAARRSRRQTGSRCWSSSSSPAWCCSSSNQFVSAYGTQVQVDTGQRMVYDLRDRLFEHLQALGLHHHITTSTGDAVYRVDVDAYCDREPGDERHLPAGDVGHDAGRDVRHPAAARRDVALLSLAVVPFLYLCLRYYIVDAGRRARSA